MPKITKPAPKGDNDNLPSKPDNRLGKITEPRCKVCMSVNRANIELLIARGYSYNSIERQMQGLGEEMSSKSIARHSERHMDIEQGAYRAVMERQVKELQEAESEGAIRIVSGKAWLDIFIQKATDVLIAGEMEIEAKDVVKAIELRTALEKEGLDLFQEEVMVQLRAIIKAFQEMLAPEIARQISERAKQIVAEERGRELADSSEVVPEAEYEVVE